LQVKYIICNESAILYLMCCGVWRLCVHNIIYV